MNQATLIVEDHDDGCASLHNWLSATFLGSTLFGKKIEEGQNVPNKRIRNVT
jgi:hypothetical protein